MEVNSQIINKFSLINDMHFENDIIYNKYKIDL